MFGSHYNNQSPSNTFKNRIQDIGAELTRDTFIQQKLKLRIITYRMINKVRYVAIVTSINSKLAVVTIKVKVKEVCKQF